MLGSYNGLGQLDIGVIGTAKDTYKTIEEMNPVIQQLGKDYGRISPLVNWLADYWSVSLVILFGVMALGSAFGTAMVLGKKKKGS